MDTVIYLSNQIEPIILTDITNITSNILLNKQQYITQITIGSSISSLDDSCFENCYKMVTINIPSSVKNINNKCFAYCYSLTKISISKGIETLGNECFLGCFKLTEIILPSSITQIGSNCFQGCINLDTIFIEKQNNLKFCGSNIFKNINKPVNILFNRTPTNKNLTFYANELIRQNDKAIDSTGPQYKYSLAHNFDIFSNGFINNKNRDATVSTNNSLQFVNVYSYYNTKVNNDNISSTFRFFNYYENTYGIIVNVRGRTISQSNFTDQYSKQMRIYDCELAYGITNISDSTFGPFTTKDKNGNNLDVEQYILNKIHIPDTVTSIGRLAFKSSTIESIELSNNLNSIGENCFAQCKKLSYVKLGNNLNNIPKNCFEGCIKLTNVVLPESIRNLNDKCFTDCTNLTHILFGRKLSTIGTGAFSNCAKLSKITFNAVNIANIDNNAFNDIKNITFICPKGPDWTSLVSIIERYNKLERANITAKYPDDETIYTYLHYGDNDVYITPESILDNTVIDKSANLLTIYIGSKVEYIKPYLFNSIDSLRYIEFRTTTNNIDLHGVFFNCKNINTIILPSSATYLPVECFSGCLSLTNIQDISKVTYIDSSCFNRCINLPSITLPDTITYIGNFCFSCCTNLTSVNIPSKLSTIPNSCFSFCSSIQNLVIPESVTNVNAYAFFGCSSLTSITLPSNLSFISTGLFANCENLLDVLLQSYTEFNITIIQEYAFKNCQNVTNLHGIISNVKTIEYMAFADCKNITHDITNAIGLNLSSPGATIGNYAFVGCTSIVELELHRNVTSIGEGCFGNCIGLKKVSTNSGLKSIPDKCFQNCANLTNVAFFPTNPTSIGEYAFSGCKSLDSILLRDVTELGVGCFLECSSLEIITLDNRINSLPDGCFNRCNNLKTVTTRTNDVNIMSIGLFCFSGCSLLTSITIPSSVIALGAWCFSSAPPMYTTDTLFTRDTDYIQNYPPQNKTLIFENPNNLVEIQYDSFLKNTIFDDIYISSITIIFKKCRQINDLSAYVKERIVSLYQNINYIYQA